MKLLLDAMLGGIRSHLRMCGHDVAYALDRSIEDDDQLLELAATEDRILCTRDENLGTAATLASGVPGSITIESTASEEQLAELAAAGVSLTLAEPPTRCGACNGDLQSVTADTPEHVPSPAECEVWQCESCGQFFWRGSHWERVEEQLAAIRRRSS